MIAGGCLRRSSPRAQDVDQLRPQDPPNCAAPRSTTTSSRRRARWRSPRPSSSSTSTTSRWPIRPASPRRARRSSPTRRTPSATPSRGNLVAVITNGTAVLGLGDIGPLAAKPVMEGKGVLFKKFAGIDVFDIEVNEKNLDKLIDLIAALEPTFGGINLEDIKAPDCFYVERALRSRMKIPVFHDDQHGTAIVVGAGVLNAPQGERQEDQRGQARHLGRRRRRARLPGPARQARHAAREHLGHRSGRRRLRRPHRADGRGQDRLRAERRPRAPWPRSSPAPTSSSACRRPACSSPRWWRRWRPSRSSSRSPTRLPRSCPKRCMAAAQRCDHRHRPHRLPEPDQQRPLLSLHLPRRARLRSDDDHGRDGDRRGACDRRARAGRVERGGDRRLRRRDSSASAPNT